MSSKGSWMALFLAGVATTALGGCDQSSNHPTPAPRATQAYANNCQFDYRDPDVNYYNMNGYWYAYDQDGDAYRCSPAGANNWYYRPHRRHHGR